MTREDRRTWTETCPSATLPTTNLTWTDIESNPGLRGKKTAKMKLQSARRSIRLRFKQTKLLLKCKTKTNSEIGSAVAQAITCQIITGVIRVRSWGSLCWICGGQSGTGSGVSPSTSIFRCHLSWHQWPIFVFINLQSML
jgi:hypothetical protein